MSSFVSMSPHHIPFPKKSLKWALYEVALSSHSYVKDCD